MERSVRLHSPRVIGGRIMQSMLADTRPVRVAALNLPTIKHGYACERKCVTYRLVDDITRFYRQPSPTSDLGRYRDQLLGLPADAEALGAIVRGLLIHNHTA